jgi:hypothetical protein
MWKSKHSRAQTTAEEEQQKRIQHQVPRENAETLKVAEEERSCPKTVCIATTEKQKLRKKTCYVIVAEKNNARRP